MWYRLLNLNLFAIKINIDQQNVHLHVLEADKI